MKAPSDSTTKTFHMAKQCNLRGDPTVPILQTTAPTVINNSNRAEFDPLCDSFGLRLGKIFCVGLLVCLYCTVCHGQSAEAIRAQWEYKQKLQARQDHFDESKKIKNDQDLAAMPPVKLNVFVTDPEFRIGHVCRIDELAFKVFQVADDRNVILQWGDTLLWLSDYPTDSLVDGEDVYVLGYVRVLKPKRYETAIGGSKTVHQIELVSRSDGLSYAEAESREIASKQKAKALAAEHIRLKDYRVFHSKVGTEVLAKFVDYVASRVVLETSDGRTIRVGIAELADEDADFVREQIKQKQTKD